MGLAKLVCLVNHCTGYLVADVMAQMAGPGGGAKERDCVIVIIYKEPGLVWTWSQNNVGAFMAKHRGIATR
jgi:hypothetical protein